MNKLSDKVIEVYAHWEGMLKPFLMGHLHAIPSRGKEIFSFEYDALWLKNNAFKLDPELNLFPGKQYNHQDQKNFGLFLDSSPDRWGRLLMKRREAQLAREEKRTERKLIESDYLLGVYDEHRIGALRFKLNSHEVFLNNDKKYASPPWTSLRELEQASFALEQENAENDPDYSKWLRMLIAPGGSLGGARPKASVVDAENHLWIAKFPSANDQNDIGAWEMVAYKLACRAGINMSVSRIKKFNSHYHTFLCKRFDRGDKGERVHFASAMTLLQHSDGDDGSVGANYLELVRFIQQYGIKPSQDLEQLWRRIVFFICVSNVDDHLRNHGFLFDAKNKGWVLSPAFDINPVADGDGLKLNISETDNSQNLELAKEVAECFQLKPKDANKIIQEVVKVVKDWRKEASQLGLSQGEQHSMARAFRIADGY